MFYEACFDEVGGRNIQMELLLNNMFKIFEDIFYFVGFKTFTDQTYKCFVKNFILV